MEIIITKDIFQQLTPEDAEVYGSPELIYLSLPQLDDPKCMKKREDWINWRAAPYPAERHSEYLYIPETDKSGETRILLSAVMPVFNRLDDYLKVISGKRRYDILGKKAIRKGYESRPIKPAEHSKEIWEIIHSSNSRQGRAIAPIFLKRSPDYDFPSYRPYNNPYYDDICLGIFAPDEKLVAYLLGKRVGDHVQYDEIMGHKDHIHNDIMYLLHITFIDYCMKCEIPPKYLNYGPWYSGDNPYSSEGGLNRWKRKVKFKPAYLIRASS